MSLALDQATVAEWHKLALGLCHNLEERTGGAYRSLIVYIRCKADNPIVD